MDEGREGKEMSKGKRENEGEDGDKGKLRLGERDREEKRTNEGVNWKFI